MTNEEFVEKVKQLSEGKIKASIIDEIEGDIELREFVTSMHGDQLGDVIVDLEMSGFKDLSEALGELWGRIAKKTGEQIRPFDNK